MRRASLLRFARHCQSRLSARMVQPIHAVLRNALESALREEIIPRNVAKLVQVPAPRYKINRSLTTQQAKATPRAQRGGQRQQPGQGLTVAR
jgi:hypothetical protein